MADTTFRGPTISIGALMDGRIETMDGPAVQYQGDLFPNPLYSPANKDGLSPGRLKGWLDGQRVTVVDTIPSAMSTTNIAAAQSPSTTSGVKLNLVTAQLGTAAGVAVPAAGIPLVAFGTSVATTVTAVDFGFTTGTTVANSSAIVVPSRYDQQMFDIGQWIIVAGAGAGGATNVPLLTQVVGFSTNANTAYVFVSPVAATGLSHTPIGAGNLYANPPSSPQFGPAAAVPSGADPYLAGGVAAVFNPQEGCARNLVVQAASIGSGTTTLTVVGFDVYGQPMQELIAANGTNVVAGKKAFKYVLSVAVQSGATTVTPALVSVGLGSSVGLNLRSDRFEYLNVNIGGTAIISPGQVAWSAALATSASTTTVDVRGLVNLSTFTVAPDGVLRVVIHQTVPVVNMINNGPGALNLLLGTAQI